MPIAPFSNNAGDQMVPAAKAAHDKGIKVVTWDSPIPSAEGEDVCFQKMSALANASYPLLEEFANSPSPEDRLAA